VFKATPFTPNHFLLKNVNFDYVKLKTLIILKLHGLL